MLGLVTTRKLDIPTRPIAQIEAEDCGERWRENGDLGSAVAEALARAAPANLLLNARVSTIEEMKVEPMLLPRDVHICIRVSGDAAVLE